MFCFVSVQLSCFHYKTSVEVKTTPESKLGCLGQTHDVVKTLLLITGQTLLPSKSFWWFFFWGGLITQLRSSSLQTKLTLLLNALLALSPCPEKCCSHQLASPEVHWHMATTESLTSSAGSGADMQFKLGKGSKLL